MAPSFVKPSFIPSLLLALFLCLAVSSSSSRTVQVSDICSKHSNPKSCANILSSIPGVVAGADLDSLSVNIINFDRVHAFDTIDMINDLVKNTTNERLKERYASCIAYYMDSLFTLDWANASYSLGDYSGMKSKGVAVLKDVQTCDSKPPPDPSALPENNKFMEDVTKIILIVADFLSGKY